MAEEYCGVAAHGGTQHPAAEDATFRWQMGDFLCVRPRLRLRHARQQPVPVTAILADVTTPGVVAVCVCVWVCVVVFVAVDVGVDDLVAVPVGVTVVASVPGSSAATTAAAAITRL